MAILSNKWWDGSRTVLLAGRDDRLTGNDEIRNENTDIDDNNDNDDNDVDDNNDNHANVCNPKPNAQHCLKWKKT